MPVLVTEACSLPEVERHDCGRIVPPDAPGLRRGLAEMVALRDDQRRAMGRRGRHLVQNDFLWEQVADRLVQVYRWLAGRREQPNSVRLD